MRNILFGQVRAWFLDFRTRLPDLPTTFLDSMIGLKSCTLNVCNRMRSGCSECYIFPQVIDNSGAVLIECVNVLKQKVNNGWGSVGDEIVCVVKSARPLTATATQHPWPLWKSAEETYGEQSLSEQENLFGDQMGELIRFDDNAAVLLNNKREMLGTRIGGVVSADLRMKGWGKIISLAPKVHMDFDAFLASYKGWRCDADHITEIILWHHVPQFDCCSPNYTVVALLIGPFMLDLFSVLWDELSESLWHTRYRTHYLSFWLYLSGDWMTN